MSRSALAISCVRRSDPGRCDHRAGLVAAAFALRAGLSLLSSPFVVGSADLGSQPAFHLSRFGTLALQAVYVLATIMPPRRCVSLSFNILHDTTMDPKLAGLDRIRGAGRPLPLIVEITKKPVAIPRRRRSAQPHYPLEELDSRIANEILPPVTPRVPQFSPKFAIVNIGVALVKNIAASADDRAFAGDIESILRRLKINTPPSGCRTRQ